MGQILVFGDSIAWGAWDTKGGWVRRLREHIDKKNLILPNYWRVVYNLGVSGDTTIDILRRFEFETKQRIIDAGRPAIIFEIGANDCAFAMNKNGLLVRPDVFRRNVEKLIRLARKYSSEIIVIGPFPVNDAETNPISWNKNFYHRNENKITYNEILKAVCKKSRVRFIDVLGKAMRCDYKSMLYDGLHPNSRGHEKIFEIVKNFLTKNKMI